MNMSKMNKVKQQTDNSADLYLYGDIEDYWWSEESNSAKTLKDKLLELGDITEINLHINSLGGDVVEGIAMFNLLKQHKAKVNVYVDGFACSIASVIAMAGDTVYMPKNAVMIIHNCWTCINGNAKELRKTAEDLDKIMESSIESYLSKVNIDRAELVELLDAETVLTAEECYEKGFADVLLPISEKIEQSATQTIMQLVKQNKEYKQKLEKINTQEQQNLNISEINLSDKDIDKISEKIIEKINNKKEERLEEDKNVFKSFFNAILKED